MIFSRLSSFRTGFGRDPHPARSQRRIIGALSGLVFSGMMVGVSASTGAVASEIVSEAPPVPPGAARVVLVDSTTTTTAVDASVQGSTTLVADTVAPDIPLVLDDAQPSRSGPPTTVRRGTATTIRPGIPGAPVTNPPFTPPGSSPTNPPVTNPPGTNPPVTSPPTTSAPTTVPPTTAAPTTTEPPPPTTAAPDPDPETP